MSSASATIASPMSALIIMVLDFLSFSVEPAEVLYEMPPYTIKIAENTPAIPMNQCSALMNRLSASMHPLVAQFVKSESLIRTARIVLIIAAADIAIAKPMKAWDRAFLPEAALVGLSPEKVYRYPP